MLVLAAFACISLLTTAGCVSFMRNLNPWATREPEKPKPASKQTSSSAEKTALKRPKIPELAQPGEHEPEGSRSSIKVSPERVESEAIPKDRKSGASSTGQENKSDKGVSTSKAEKTDSSSSKSPSDEAVEEPYENIDRKNAFKKHDHVAYVKLIKTKADALIEKQSDCTLARLCRNTISDEWTLQVFTRQTKTFSFVLYSWDEIDEKWEKSADSTTMPIGQWEHHLRFSSACKECTNVKGTP